MRRTTTPPHLTGSLRIGQATLDDLLSALRRHHRADCERLLAAWAAEPEPSPTACRGKLEDEHDVKCIDHPLTGWVHLEVAGHVIAGRFEHALCLIETYRSTARRPVEPDQLTLTGVLR